MLQNSTTINIIVRLVNSTRYCSTNCTAVWVNVIFVVVVVVARYTDDGFVTNQALGHA